MGKVVNNKVARRWKVRRRIRKRLYGTLVRPRFSVFKSNRCMYAQLINDETGETLVASSFRKLQLSKNDIVSALALGKAIAEQAIAKSITAVVFDRSGYLYHGKVKALAQGAREQGLKF